MADLKKAGTATVSTKLDATEAPKKVKETPIYRLVFKQVIAEEDYLDVEKQVNKLIEQGYEPFGGIAVDHLEGKGGHTDVVQPMVKTSWLLKRLAPQHLTITNNLGAVEK